ncbi:MAG: insulinase family protein [Lachnospiraceae bacterium]|nr:insulinase family protein [Lachnospiraceae bacterium]MDD7023646.1 pitrilysin family protein [Oscillospiraceae bacterium]
MVKEFFLKNGIQVIYEPMQEVRTVSFGVWVKVGSAYETKKNNGISHVIEHMLFKGTKTRTAKDIADMTAKLGGNLNAFTGKECTAYYLKTLDDQLPEAMELISDMICNSRISEEQLQTEKQVIIDEISMYNDSCEDMVHEKLQKKVWAHHPLGYIISGKKKIVQGFTQEEILDFMKAAYTGDNILISAAGHLDEERFHEDLERYFGSIPPRGSLKPLTVPAYHVCDFRKYRDIEQVHLDIAFNGIPVDARERYAFSLANSILGGSVSSRLFQKIREEEGRAYSIYSYGSNFQKAGLWQIYAATNREQLDATIGEIYDQICLMKRDGITEEELMQAKHELRSELIIGNESTQSRMDNNAKSLMSYGKIISLDETVDQLMRVTREEICDFMQQWADPDNSSICVMGNY